MGGASRRKIQKKKSEKLLKSAKKLQKSFKNLPKKYRKAFKNAYFFSRFARKCRKNSAYKFSPALRAENTEKKVLKKNSRLRGEIAEKKT